MRVKALVATTNRDDQGEFTIEALESISKQSPGKEVLLHFNKEMVVSSVISSELTDKGVVVEAELDIDEKFLPGFVVPGFIVLREMCPSSMRQS